MHFIMHLLLRALISWKKKIKKIKAKSKVDEVMYSAFNSPNAYQGIT
jgi:hypothetical protein